MTTALAYSSGVTTLEDAAAQFAAYMVGWQVMLNPAQPVLRTISAVPSATQLQFAGDGVNLAAAGDFYRVFAPPGVMGDANGANWGHQHCDVRYGCSVSFGWAGYRYFAPVAGFVADHSGGFAIHSRQGASINLVGNYHCWNRVYSPYLGRWTTPDPLASPWWNLQDYCDNSPLQYTDASGLGFAKGLKAIVAKCDLGSLDDWIKELRKKIEDNAAGWKRLQEAQTAKRQMQDGQNCDEPSGSSMSDIDKTIEFEERKYDGHKNDIANQSCNVLARITEGLFAINCISNADQAQMKAKLNEISDLLDKTAPDGSPYCPKQKISKAGDAYEEWRKAAMPNEFDRLPKPKPATPSVEDKKEDPAQATMDKARERLRCIGNSVPGAKPAAAPAPGVAPVPAEPGKPGGGNVVPLPRNLPRRAA